MRVGLQIPHFRPSTPDTMGSFFAEIAQAAEESGFYSLWVMDHFYQLGGWLGEPETPMVEGYAALGYMAALTRSIKLGLMVGGVIYRHPSLVIKTVSTLDVLSGGRMYFGIGAAWYEHEAKSLGMPFPEMKVRFQQLEDILRLAHHMWRGDTTPFVGKQYSVPYPVNNPQPLSQPHPPILIGGTGRTKTLRFVAQYADASNIFASRPDAELVELLDVLKGHCDKAGRPYEEIEKTALYTVQPDAQTSAETVVRFRRLEQLGFSHIIHNVRGNYTPELIARLGKEVVAEVAG